MLVNFARVSGRVGRRLVLVGAACILGSSGTADAAGLTIVPTFDSTITSDPNAATIQATINQAIAIYNSTFSDNITVRITFQSATTGLGGSSTFITSQSYSNVRTALLSHATSANDAIANTNVPLQSTSPVDGLSNMWLSLPNARVLGLLGASNNSDCTITLNTSICNLNRTVTQDPAKYDLRSVAMHEMDECFGLGSGLNISTSFPRQSRPQDLFRYSAAGTRSYSTSSSATSYLSINGGVTNLVGFNQNGGGDYGDWDSVHTSARVQDAFGTPGAQADLGVEITNLDVIGFTVVPEPACLGAVAFALAGGLLCRHRQTA